MIKKKNISLVFNVFLLAHLIMWTFVPFLSNKNLPLDVIEALAWGTNLDWGWEKHPPLSVLFPETFYQIFGNLDLAYYLLSQIFIVLSFIFIFKLAKEFLKNEVQALLSVFLLEGIYFYNFTTPEFNVNVCQIPFWTMSVYYCWQSLKDNKIKNWLLLGLFAALGVLSKYLFVYLLVGMFSFFIFYLKKKKKFNLRYFIPVLVFLLVLTPHLMWLVDNNYKTITYGLERTSLENNNFLNHILHPLKFIIVQAVILIPFFGMLSLIISKFKFKFNYRDEKLIYLICVTFVPILLMLLTSLIIGANIRTMWMTPFYLFFGLLFIYIFKSRVDPRFLKKFISVFLFIFILSPSIYLYVSLSNDNKRTDFQGKEIARLVQVKWNKNFTNKISIVVGDEWLGGNLSYHLQSRPRWFNNLNPELKNLKLDGGVIYTGNASILKLTCPGEFGKIQLQGICMIGIR